MLTTQVSRSLNPWFCDMHHCVHFAWDYVRRGHKARPTHMRLMCSRDGGWSGNSEWWKDRCWIHVGELHATPWVVGYRGIDGLPKVYYRNWREHLVGMAAHEFQHLFSNLYHGKEAEREAIVKCIKAVKAWRKVK